jgi:ketosteroid isomerase-like protein
MSGTIDHTAIATLLHRMSEAWRAGRFDTLEEIFHADMVIAAPGTFDARITGREACIQTYRDFAERATITAYQEEPVWIGVWGPTANASFGWQIAWDDETGAHTASGRDVLCLNKGDDGWRVVGRLMLEETRS